MPLTIHSEHLDLVLLSSEFMRAFLGGNLAEAERVLGYVVPGELMEASDVMQMRLRQMEEDAAYEPWSLRAMVLRETGEVVGHIGFHTAPDPEYLQLYAPGGVEFGFTVFPPFRRRGYAREASLAMMDWAKQRHPRLTSFVLSIAPGNAPSQALAAGLGFVRIGSHMDEVDGEENILLLRLATVAEGQIGSGSSAMGWSKGAAELQ